VFVTKTVTLTSTVQVTVTPQPKGKEACGQVASTIITCKFMNELKIYQKCIRVLSTFYSNCLSSYSHA